MSEILSTGLSVSDGRQEEVDFIVNNGGDTEKITLIKDSIDQGVRSYAAVSTSSVSTVASSLNIVKDEKLKGDESFTMKVVIGPQHFDLLKLIGEGAFGKVILVKNCLDSKLYAMKVISKKLLTKKNHISYMKSERDILTKVDHPFVVSLWFAFQSEKKIFLVMDFLAGGELFFHLKRRGLIMEHEVRFYLGEMILAIEFLHNKGIIHRDLKPENILLSGDGHVCITDFGLAKEIGDLESARTLCGTSEYMAPEMLTRNGYGKGVDWWSLGALCYEMMAGKPPFTAKTQKDLDRKILSEKITCPSYLTATAHSLLRGMLEKDLNKRLGASKSTMFSLGGVAALKQHPFFEDLNWTALINLEIEPPIDLSVPPTPAPLSLTKPSPSNEVNESPNYNSNNHLDEDFSPMSPKGDTYLSPTKNDPNNKDLNNNKSGGSDTSSRYKGGESPCLSLTADHLTRHFHEGFTGQHISLSVVEEQLSQCASETTGNGSECQYDGFEFIGEGFECSENQIKRFEEDLIIKTAKMMKKQKLKFKRDGERAEKLQQTEKEKMQKDASEKEAKMKREELEGIRLMREKTLAEQEKRKEAFLRARSIRLKKVSERQSELDVFAAQSDVVQKKLKGFRKKLRDIEELEGKIRGGLTASKEQKEKVSKRQGIEDDISEMEEEDDKLTASTPAPIPLEWLVEEVEEAAEVDDEAKVYGIEESLKAFSLSTEPVKFVVPIVINAKVVTKTVHTTEPLTAMDTTEITVTIKSTIGIDNTPPIPQPSLAWSSIVQPSLVSPSIPQPLLASPPIPQPSPSPSIPQPSLAKTDNW
eukprot:CAMPEP_0119044698 /NCGR_PEP_ID=MMETSP1177-20130426/33696_1 /TAXON_ID=2985 /ORGANISM="Ochromonas sp, Strain CCMP1899" /LENGTH=813 /DNA_ID=CAMNT_0007015211 /DNA_START=211 /DNA_END=2649 /DNA_ORIENTATION=-